MSAEEIAVSVKWGKESIETRLVPANGVKALKAELEEATGVPFDRMKLMAKSKGLWKGVLKDDFDLSTVDFAKIKPPIQILLMGSAAKLAAPKTKAVFVEDLPPEEAAKVAAEPSGLVNLGNTCYLNSVLQCLRAVPPLRSALLNYTPSNASHTFAGTPQSNRVFILSLRDLFFNLDRTANAVPPSTFVMATKMAFPQFAQTGPQGQPMQQDAEEFFSGLLTIAAGERHSLAAIKAGFLSIGKTINENDLNGANNLIDAVFGMKMEETLTCDELAAPTTNDGANAMDVEGNVSGIEPAVKSYDLHRKLVCNIQGGSDASSQVNVTHIAEGITLSLNGKVEKRSEVLGRDAIWTRKQRISRLPPVIVVQFGRFYWKETPDSQDHAGVKCKVMKPVAFTSTLDVFEFCSGEVQKVLKLSRDKAQKEEEDRIAKKLNSLENAKATEGDVAMDTNSDGVEEAKAGLDADNVDVDSEELKAALALSMRDYEETPSDVVRVGPGLPDDFQGMYELFAVVTHKGRDADGGHYMGWVRADVQDSKKSGDDTDEINDDWFVFDDDEVSPCKTEDVLKLKGGGDWHMSYLNFYRAKK